MDEQTPPPYKSNTLHPTHRHTKKWDAHDFLRFLGLIPLDKACLGTNTFTNTTVSITASKGSLEGGGSPGGPLGRVPATASLATLRPERSYSSSGVLPRNVAPPGSCSSSWKARGSRSCKFPFQSSTHCSEGCDGLVWLIMRIGAVHDQPGCSIIEWQGSKDSLYLERDTHSLTPRYQPLSDGPDAAYPGTQFRCVPAS
jgi:hypothetical protein